MQLAHNNRVLAPDIDTVFFMTSIANSYVSSSLVKEIAGFGGDVSAMLPGPALHRAAGRLWPAADPSPRAIIAARSRRPPSRPPRRPCRRARPSTSSSSSSASSR